MLQIVKNLRKASEGLQSLLFSFTSVSFANEASRYCPDKPVPYKFGRSFVTEFASAKKLLQSPFQNAAGTAYPMKALDGKDTESVLIR